MSLLDTKTHGLNCLSSRLDGLWASSAADFIIFLRPHKTLGPPETSRSFFSTSRCSKPSKSSTPNLAQPQSWVWCHVWPQLNLWVFRRRSSKHSKNGTQSPWSISTCTDGFKSNKLIQVAEKTRWNPRTRMPTRMLRNRETILISHIFERTHLWDTLSWHTEATLL